MHRYHISYTIYYTGNQFQSDKYLPKINNLRNDFRNSMKQEGAIYTVDTTFYLDKNRLISYIGNLIQKTFDNLCTEYQICSYCDIDYDICEQDTDQEPIIKVS